MTMKVMKTAQVTALAVSLGLLMSGCASSMFGGAYSREQTRQVQEVQMGVVEGVRSVQIEGTKSPVGALGGAALGGVAGSAVGEGTGKAAATVAGALLGGLAGSAAEEAVTRQPGVEITVRLDNGRTIAVTQGADEFFNPGDRVRVLTSYDGTARVTH
jgi:outer membrane lipoprotein SlyB